MNLHDQMTRSLETHLHTEPDVDRLVRAARADGRRRVRARRVATAAATVAVLAVGGVAVSQVPLGGESPAVTQVDPDAAAPGSVDLPGPSARTAPATDRGAVAALAWALGQESDGTTSGYHGQPPLPAYGSLDYYARLFFDDGSGLTEVGVNVQFEVRSISRCVNAARCSRTVLGDGSRVTRYEQREGDAVRRVVDLLRPDGVRVVIGALNGVNPMGAPTRLTRPEPAFDYPALQRVVERDFWGARLPTSFLAAGRTLEPFETKDAVVDATPMPPPD